MKRTQIYLKDEQDTRLAKRAKAHGVTKSTVIREAIERYLLEPMDEDTRLSRFRRAVSDVARRPVGLPDGRTYVEQIRALDRLREDEIERRRR